MSCAWPWFLIHPGLFFVAHPNQYIYILESHLHLLLYPVLSFDLIPLYSRPFGYNEFDGAGSGYAIKFASLSNIDENVVVGSTPATGEKRVVKEHNKLGKKNLPFRLKSSVLNKYKLYQFCSF